MRARLNRHVIPGALALICLAPNLAEAQNRGKKDDGGLVEITLSVGERESIRDYYSANPDPDAQALPPGIRKKLARGKPMPPGIAKKGLPKGLAPALSVPDGYDVVEVGLDVLLVEVATGIIHDVLMDVIP